MIVLTSNSDSTYKAQRRYREVAMIVLMRRPARLKITQYALKGQKLLAQGIALGNYERKPVAL